MIQEETAARSEFLGDARAQPGMNESSGGSSEGNRAMKADRIGFIGLGRMGAAMAANLAAIGHQVTAFVRHPERMAELQALGLKPTTKIRDVFDCNIVISMLSDDDAVREVVFGREDIRREGLIKGLSPGAIHISMSTISTAAASEVAAAHAGQGQGYVSAPVFGNPDAARAHQLYVIAAGALTDVERCQPIFAAIGQQTFVVGEDPSTANLIKLIGNALGAATMQNLSEAFALARKRGLDPHKLFDVLTGTMYGGRFHRIYGEKIAADEYGSSNFVLPLALKDVRLALNEAELAGAPTPSFSVARDRLIAGIARGYSQLDWSALGLVALEEAGLAIQLPMRAAE